MRNGSLISEDADLIALFDWIRLSPELEPFCWHVANERKCSARYGSYLRRKGVKSGVSDIQIAIPIGKYHGMFLELKVGKGKPTKNQLKFLQDMSDKGYYAIWRTGFEACQDAICEYLGWRIERRCLVAHAGETAFLITNNSGS